MRGGRVKGGRGLSLVGRVCSFFFTKTLQTFRLVQGWHPVFPGTCLYTHFSASSFLLTCQYFTVFCKGQHDF